MTNQAKTPNLVKTPRYIPTWFKGVCDEYILDHPTLPEYGYIDHRPVTDAYQRLCWVMYHMGRIAG